MGGARSTCGICYGKQRIPWGPTKSCMHATGGDGKTVRVHWDDKTQRHYTVGQHSSCGRDGPIWMGGSAVRLGESGSKLSGSKGRKG